MPRYPPCRQCGIGFGLRRIGRMDGFWESGLSKWDIAAGIVLVREAGGFVSDLEGGESFWETGNIVAANAKCFRPLIQTLKLTCHRLRLSISHLRSV